MAELPREVLQPPHPTKRQRFGVWIASAALIIVAVAIGIFLYWSFQSDNILTVNNEPFPVRTINDPARGGNVVVLKVDYCKNVDATGQLRMSFFSSEKEVFLPLVQEKGEKGCQVVDFPILIPEGVEPGMYQVKFRATYKLNPLKSAVVDEFVSRPFKVE